MRPFVRFTVCVILGITQATASMTYNLYFDGILSRKVTASLSSTSSIDGAVPLAFLTDLSTDLLNDVINVYNSGRPENTDRPPVPDALSAGECPVEKDDISCKQNGAGGRCLAQHTNTKGDMDLYAATHIHQSNNKIAFRSEVTLTAPTAFLARQTLVRVVSKVNQRFGHDENFVWSIQHQPSMLETTEPSFRVVDSVIAAQEEKDRHAASVEELILSNPLMKNRRQLDATHSEKGHLLEVWSYEDVKFYDPVKALFIDGYLATTTAHAGAIHAEALTHPAIIAHPSPTRALVISLTPHAIVKEMLKYKSIEHVSVVGSDVVTAKLIENHLPTLNDCSFLAPEGSRRCMESSLVDIVREDLTVWLSREDKARTFYDVMFVDIPIGKHEWLSADIYKDLLEYGRGSCMIVVGTGSLPSLYDIDSETVLSPRQSLIRQAARDQEHGGLDLDTLLYDEPLAHPLSSTFIIMFPGALDTSYNRFVRRNAPAIDVDLVNRLRPGISDRGHPTIIYDGPTHLNYLMISRAWEHWYCQTIPGRNLPICDTFLPNWFNSSMHFYNTEVKRDPRKGRSLIATKDVPKGHFVLPHDAALGIRVERDKWEALNKFVEDFPDAEMFRQFRDFVIAYGFESESLARSGWVVSIACNNSFTNHACTKEEETTTTVREIHYSEDGGEVQFSPPVNRRADLFGVLTMTSRDVKAGEELTIDYRCFRDDEDDPEFNAFLNNMCENGRGLVNDAVADE